LKVKRFVSLFEYSRVENDVFLTEKFKSATTNSLFNFKTSPIIELIVPPDENTAICSQKTFLISLVICFIAFIEFFLNSDHGIIPSIIISLLTHLCKKYLNPNIM